MSGEENFKKTLNDLLNAKEFPFEEGNWQQAEKFITASRRKRRLRPLLWIIPAAFLGGASLLFMGDESAQHLSENQKTITSAEQQVPNTVVASEEKQTQDNVTSHDVIPETPSPTKSASKETVKEVVDKPVTNPVPSTTPKEIKPLPSQPKIDEPVKVEPVEDVKISTSIGAGKEPKTKDVSSQAHPNENSQNDLSKKQSVDDNNDQKLDDTNNNSQKQSDLKPEVAGVSADQQKATEDQSNLQTGTTAPAETAATNTATNTQESAEPNAQAAAPAPSVAAVAAALPDTDYVALQRPLLTVEAGANLARGWNSGENKEAGGINPLIGLNYFQNLNSRFAVSAGIQYYSIGNLKASTYTSRIVNYGHGEQSQVSEYTPTRLHYLALPLQVNYRIGSANIIGMGINVAYLLTVDVTKVQYNQGINGPTSPQTSKDRGYTQGFKQFDNQICLFYRRRFLTNAFAGAELYYGLSPVKDEFFNANGKEKNMGLKITLGYYLLKSK